jgi:hypothetical protein
MADWAAVHTLPPSINPRLLAAKELTGMIAGWWLNPVKQDFTN